MPDHAPLAIRNDRTRILALALLLAAALALAAYPLLGAGIVLDDWFWLALVRHLDHPFGPYVDGILHEYFYRPSSIAFWWISERLFGNRAPGHYAASLLMHLGNAVLLALLLRRCGREPWRAWLAALLFVVMPAAIGTAAWLSNRNELLAVFAGLGFLLSFEHSLANRRRAWLAGLFLALSLTSKETGLIFAGLASLRILAGEPPERKRLGLWLAILLPLLLFFLMRKLTIVPVGINVTWESVRSAAPVGILAWIKLLPSAIGGFDSAAAWRWLVAAGVGIASLAALLRALSGSSNARDRSLLVGLVFLMLPPLLQWPITHAVLPDGAAAAHTANLRFYYLPVAGLAILMSGAWFGPAPARNPRVVLSATMAWALLAMVASWQLAHAWRAGSADNDREVRAVAGSVLAGSYTPGCSVLLRRDHWPGGFVEYADVMVKSIAQRGDPVLGCAFFTTAMHPWHALLPRARCQTALWPGLTTRYLEPTPLMRPIGNLCLAGFYLPTAGNLVMDIP